MRKVVFLILCLVVCNTIFAKSNKTKDKYEDLFPANKYFMKSIDVFSIDTNATGSCKKIFTQLCGEAHFPLRGDFTKCLENKYNQYKENASCEGLGTALIANNYLVWLVRTTDECNKYFDKCTVQLVSKTQKEFNKCLATDKTISPLCIKLVQDAVLNTYVLTEIYDHLKTSW